MKAPKSRKQEKGLIKGIQEEVDNLKEGDEITKDLIERIKSLSLVNPTVAMNFIYSLGCDKLKEELQYVIKACDEVLMHGLNAQPYNSIHELIKVYKGLSNKQTTQSVRKVLDKGNVTLINLGIGKISLIDVERLVRPLYKLYNNDCDGTVISTCAVQMGLCETIHTILSGKPLTDMYINTHIITDSTSFLVFYQSLIKAFQKYVYMYESILKENLDSSTTQEIIEYQSSVHKFFIKEAVIIRDLIDEWTLSNEVTNNSEYYSALSIADGVYLKQLNSCIESLKISIDEHKATLSINIGTEPEFLHEDYVEDEEYDVDNGQEDFDVYDESYIGRNYNYYSS